jgi:hypothetical protein
VVDTLNYTNLKNDGDSWIHSADRDCQSQIRFGKLSGTETDIAYFPHNPKWYGYSDILPLINRYIEPGSQRVKINPKRATIPSQPNSG